MIERQIGIPESAHVRRADVQDGEVDGPDAFNDLADHIDRGVVTGDVDSRPSRSCEHESGHGPCG